jgi:outer membrane protein OmpA-like peptidoglycan-associated protein
MVDVPLSGAGNGVYRTRAVGYASKRIVKRADKTHENLGRNQANMKTTIYIAAALALSLASAGCATKKYVAKTIAPVEARVSATETKNTEQDQKIAAEGTQLEAVDRDLSRTKERLTDTDAKATAAGAAARQANDAAVQAGNSAQAAQQAADGAKTAAKDGLDKLGNQVDGMVKFKMTKSGVVLFAVGQKALDADAKSALDDFAKAADGQMRYVIEVQGFADKTGDRAMNDILSQARAEAVARYLANEHMIPLRSITMLGTGIASGEQKTREERKESRKVEFRLYLPEVANITASN